MDDAKYYEAKQEKDSYCSYRCENSMKQTSNDIFRQWKSLNIRTQNNKKRWWVATPGNSTKKNAVFPDVSSYILNMQQKFCEMLKHTAMYKEEFQTTNVLRDL